MTVTLALRTRIDGSCLNSSTHSLEYVYYVEYTYTHVLTSVVTYSEQDMTLAAASKHAFLSPHDSGFAPWPAWICVLTTSHTSAYKAVAQLTSGAPAQRI